VNCRHCRSKLQLQLIDLGISPLSNAYLKKASLHKPEPAFPLRVLVCEKCWLVQTEDFVSPNDIFDSEYAYYSSYSNSWLSHCQRYAKRMVHHLSLTKDNHVVEIGANDGYLLQFFKKMGIPCTGIEPTASTASTARSKGIKIVQSFFSKQLADKIVAQGRRADLIIANNVLAHVPDINDFIKGIVSLLSSGGLVTVEFPHLLKLIENKQFDTIYHEHFSYLSLTTVNQILTKYGLEIIDVEEYPTHGGSLRIYARQSVPEKSNRHRNVEKLLKQEQSAGVASSNYYLGYEAKIKKIRQNLQTFLAQAKSEKQSVAAYGAAAKGNTLLNYAGVNADQILFVADRNPAKQGKYLPGSRIPIVDENRLLKEKPDFVLILPWNLKQEIAEQLAYIAEWGGKFVTVIPNLEVSD
jgi:2-polyprenyl-3-methyl-5-hydroxy-6-metoxy-1,4-benzoquinol methylase